MKALHVQGRNGALSAAGVRTYRQHGLVVVENFLSPQETHELTATVRAAAVRRGTKIFPGLDPDIAGELKFDAKMQPKPSVDWDRVNAAGHAPADVRAREREAMAGKNLGYSKRTVEMRFRNQRQIDRAYRKLARRRAQYANLRVSPRLTTDEEEMSGRVSDKRIRKAGEAYTEEQLQKDFEEYKRSGRLEMEMRRESHIDDSFAYIGAWAKCWSYLASDSEDVRRLVVGGGDGSGGSIGRRVGEAAAALSGEVVVRMFADGLYESLPFLNATPMAFAALGCNYASSTALSVMIGLEDSTGQDHAGAQRVVAIPGSHSVMLSMTNNGTDTSRFQLSGIFDFGKLLRLTPELRGLEAVVLPPIAPGSALFASNFLVAGTAPTLEGCALSPYVPPQARLVSNPYSYSVSLMPDRCAFDGERHSWASRDSHGPLYALQKGELLTDDRLFPVLHRALDIE